MRVIGRVLDGKWKRGEGDPMAGASKGALHPKGLAVEAARGFDSRALRN